MHNAVRATQVRPLNDRERNEGLRSCVTFDEPSRQVVLQVNRAEPGAAHAMSETHTTCPSACADPVQHNACLISHLVHAVAS